MGTEARIQLNDNFAEVRNSCFYSIRKRFETRRVGAIFNHCSLKVDKEANMGIGR